LHDTKELRYYEDPTRRSVEEMVMLSDLKIISKSVDHKAKKKYGQFLYILKLEFEANIMILASLSRSERNEWYDKMCSMFKAKNKIKIKPKKKKKKAPPPPPKKKNIRSKSAMIGTGKERSPPAIQKRSNLLSPSTTSKCSVLSPSSKGYQSDTIEQMNLLKVPTKRRKPSKLLSPSSSSKNYNEQDDIHWSLRKEIEDLQNELLYLKMQTAINSNNDGLVSCSDDVYVDDALLDCDQYLILDKHWKKWTYLEIVEWITNLNHGKYSKYKKILFANMKYRRMAGIYLPQMEKSDLTNFFGIRHFGDVCSLWDSIQSLIDS